MSTIDTTSDEQLVHQIRTTDKELFRYLIRRYKKKLYRYINSLVYHAGLDIEDILQEVFIKAFINLHAFDTKKKFSSWLYRIAHNTVIDTFRKKNHHQKEDLEEEKFLGENNYKQHMEQTIDTAFLRKKLTKYLQAIPNTYREVLVLFYFEELSYEEISDVLHVPVQTVGSLLHRGRKMLREILVQKGERYE